MAVQAEILDSVQLFCKYAETVKCPQLEGRSPDDHRKTGICPQLTKNMQNDLISVLQRGRAGCEFVLS